MWSSLNCDVTTELFCRVPRLYQESKLATVFCFSQSYDSSSICSELDRLQEHIEAERRDMLERLLEMRESFEREAVELRQMLDHDKARLRQQLRSVI